MTDNLGPDSLRALIDRLTYCPGDNGGEPYRSEGFAHADAWEAEREELMQDNAALRKKEKTKDEGWFNSIIEVGALRKDNAALRDECQVLRQRLEAAERYHSRYAEYIRSWVGKDHDEDARQSVFAVDKP